MSGSANMEERTMNIVKILAVGTFLASTLAAGGVLAKAHDQGVKGSFAGTGPGPAEATPATARGGGGGRARPREQGGRGRFAGSGPGRANETTATAAQGLGAALGDAR